MIRSYTSLLSWLGLTIIASLMLYHTSDRVNALDRQLRGLNTQIESEQKSLRVLKAEWVYLSNPARIEAEAQRHLSMLPTAPRRVAALQHIASVLPLRGGIDDAPVVLTAEAAPVSKPAATASSGHHDRILAAIRNEHVNDHMTLPYKVASEKTSKTSAVVPTDKIGALIGTLSLRP